MADINAEGRFLLGTLGWERADWLSDYYPPDLPADWRLAYYSNDCGCVLLPEDVWGAGDRDLLEQSLDEAGGRLHFFLEAPTRMSPDLQANLSLFARYPAGLLVQRPESDQLQLPQWVARGAGVWDHIESGASLVLWALEQFDLRTLRARLDAMPKTVRAVVLEGPAASPGRVPELRTLLELMGKA